jgi:hypothetical protein
VRPVTLEQAKGALKHLEPFDDRLIETLNRAEVEDLVQALARRAPPTAQVTLRVCKRVLADAKARGQVVDQRIFDITPSRYVEREPFVPSWRQADELASWMPEFMSRIVPFALASGRWQPTGADARASRRIRHRSVDEPRLSATRCRRRLPVQEAAPVSASMDDREPPKQK